ncbi:hypothetical protein KFL_001150130 [Klebsormidium nitens]|uniref:Uncharacterized protein n=1 Tax=Klebsormidium nitens TaxID=105231 RepID=A0A1Y1HXR4_KLENI|nr:hypothetical protein KFL_001150130 [Klebsormidium nitens]|eukprot:GAQ82552.1 hypothetical protein KFL_001150130 [Klebsormidium nitens]
MQVAALPQELLSRILNLAVERDLGHKDQRATTWAQCKLVCREWRDYARGTCTTLVVASGAGKSVHLREALQNYPHVAELEIVGTGNPSGFERQYELLSSRAWFSVELHTVK